MDTLSKEIDELELDEMDKDEIVKVISSLSKEGMALRKKRKVIRYNLYRLKTEALGGPSSKVDTDFKELFEKDPLFDGWKLFSVTWDVALDDPNKCVHRKKSVAEEWDELIAAKFPQLTENGGVRYPDITVRNKVKKHHSQQV